MADPGEGPGGPSPPLFLDQKGAQRAEKKNFRDRASPLSEGSGSATDNGTTGAGKISRDYTSCEMHTD